MIIRVCAFTDNGIMVAKKLREGLNDHIVEVLEKGEASENLIEDSFINRIPLVFVGACGIAVRKIAPFVKDKLKDTPVIVVDELGRYVIPVLSGHVGGANRIAGIIGKCLGADVIITTATDINDTFSVDLWAHINGLRIVNREGIAKTSSKLLASGSITMYIEDGIRYEKEDIPACISLLTGPENADVIVTNQELEAKGLILMPKTLCVGMGCKKDTDVEKIEKLFEATVKNPQDVYGIASIDLKAKEYGMLRFAQKNGYNYHTYSAEELMEVSGDFEGSEFVLEKTGADNVCERAARILAGENSELIVKKTSQNGVTIAVCERVPAIISWDME